MRLDRIELQVIELPLIRPFRTSGGTTTARPVMLLKLDAGGVRGYGECVAPATPHYTGETAETARVVLERHLIPLALGGDFETARELGSTFDSVVRANPMARAALEMALWDVEAKIRDVPLAELLGGERKSVPVGVVLGMERDAGLLIERIGVALGAGYRGVKLKIGPGSDIPVLESVRRRFPDASLGVDANASYTSEDAEHLLSLDRFGLTMIEQPLPADDLLGLARLQERLETPVCLDESITSVDECRVALRLGSGRMVNIKPGRVGGHAAATRIHDLCEEAGVAVWCGGMLESGVGRAHALALASLSGFRAPADLSASGRYWSRDVVRPEFTLGPDGTIRVPDGPGIGVEVDEQFLSEIELDRKVFPARG